MSVQSIAVVGSVALDTIETPNDYREDLIGGSATYATVSAGRSCSVYPVGIVGNDFPSQGFDIFRKYSQNLHDLQIGNGSTFRWGGKYSGSLDDRETLFTELGVFETFSPKLSSVSKNVDYLFLANIHPALQLSVMAQMQGNPVIVVDTMNLWIETTNELLKDVIKKSHILLLNDSEARLMTGKKSIADAAEKLLLMGPEKVIIKRGSRGCVLFTQSTSISLGVFPIKNVIDTTGAGDTFGGGYIAGLATGMSEVDSLIQGSALASVCVEDFGVQSLLTLNQEELTHRHNIISKSVSS